MRRVLGSIWTSLGEQHPSTQIMRKNYELLLQEMGHNPGEIKQRLAEAQRPIR